MKRYIKSFSLSEFETTFGRTNDVIAYSKKLQDPAGNILELNIMQWANGWDWLLKDNENLLIADSDEITFDTPEEALDDFNDWVRFNE